MLSVVALHSLSPAQSLPSDGEVKASLHRATRLMTQQIADHGGYAWVSSVDGRFSHGEGVAGADRVWVQPPGTPAVGLAFLAAYHATGDAIHLDAAKAVGGALVQGQLQSGGWGYSIEFDPKLRARLPYRVLLKQSGASLSKTFTEAPTPYPGGWDVWSRRQFKSNMTLIDDDTTPCAIRFLCELDRTLKFKDATVHEAVEYALRSTMAAQYPGGAWGHNYDRFSTQQPSVDHYPVISASYPESWSRTWTKSFDGCYMLNDRITQNMVETMLFASRVYNNERYRCSALAGGDFLLRAQMPEPQPAWAQQYDRHMHPAWDRKFEPPAISGRESQDALRTLLVLFRETGETRFLEPVPRAIAYLRTCLRSDGKLARYYELKTNRPIYFNNDYQISYDDRSMPDHYAFVVDSDLEAIERDYQTLASGKPLVRNAQVSDQQVADVIRSQSASGGWLEQGFVRDEQGKKVTPKEGVVSSATMIANIELLSQFLEQN
ncbi:polysaccharide lyase family protein 10 [Rhodopirellula maiorica SM1]|uniref:Polysaccharide lyase family protein 10 n=1 Tax=Rhodopirellula maiorica SM1 TaxID=1265738 RepID=M5RZN5_9BACT|nr:polysaccharide lyase family protein 10 [Rhodopirellula maiorica SM1]